MSILFQTDGQRVQLYLAENAGWMKITVAQKNEIPELKKNVTREENSGNDDRINAEKDLFRNKLTM